MTGVRRDVLGKFSASQGKNYIISWLIVLCIFVIFSFISPNFKNLSNISNLLSSMSTILIASVGLVQVLLIGSIDLSIGYVSSCACVIFMLTLSRFGAGAFLIALGFGAVAGVINAIISVYVKIPSFIATFGTQSIWASVALILSGGSPVVPNKSLHMYLNWYTKQVCFIPLPFIIAMICVVVFRVIEQRTSYGKSLYAIGANEQAAIIAGVKINRTKVLAFLLSGVMAAAAGILMASKIKIASPLVGENLTTNTIASIVIGGTSLSGGKGSGLQNVGGVALIIMIQYGMNVLGINTYWQTITLGLIILCAIFFVADRKERNLIVK